MHRVRENAWLRGVPTKKRFLVELFYRNTMLQVPVNSHCDAFRAVLFTLCVLLLSSCGQKRAAQVHIPKRGETQTGLASWYGYPYHGRRAANGEVFDMNKLTAAHRKWPFDTIVRVRNLSNQREVDVRITDRGPFVDGRIIDLSRAAAQEIDMVRAGVVKVKLKVVQTPSDYHRRRAQAAGPVARASR